MALEPTPVLVLACDRPVYLRRALRAIFRNDDESGRRIFVSQDGTDDRVRTVVLEFDGAIEHLSFAEPIREGSALNDQGTGYVRDEDYHLWAGYYRVAQHYGWAFGQLFDQQGLKRVIVLEDDLEVAPDFFGYFRAAARLMDRDPTVWTVSAWNDNSYPSLVSDPERLFRSEFFPGLGWLMTRTLWDELRDGWPLTHWDHWLRSSDQHKGRSVICPEISRTYNFGRDGISGSEFYDAHLKSIMSNDIRIDFSRLDLDYLIKDCYDTALRAAVNQARTVEPGQLVEGSADDAKIPYHGESSFNRIAEHFGLWPDFGDADMPRCSYQGVVSFRDRGRTVYLVPLSYLAGDEFATVPTRKPDR